MKVQSTHYKGIEFVSFQELPAEQQLLLQHNTELERIQILIDGKVCRNCIQYKDYSDWYASVFLKSIPVQEPFKKPVKRSEVAMEV
jgi:hypothetical protein